MTRGRTVLTNVNAATLQSDTPGYGLICDAAIALEGDKICWVGPKDDLPTKWRALPQVDLGGRLATPSLIDCHTHIVYGGSRAREFEMRLNGATYEEIARAGGGIRSTVAATRAASEDELLAYALPRVDALLREGVTLLEIKSGYGLDLDSELKMLRVARKIGTLRPVQVLTTFLGAHALPPEYEGRSDEYIDFVCDQVLPAVQSEGLADAVDAFCEGIAFSPAQVSRVFDRAQELGLPVKIHSEQLSNLGGTTMAAHHKALSADHLEYLDEAGVQAMKDAGTVAVLLPGAFYYLRETQHPPLQLLRDAGVPVALATDANPGSSPLTSLLLCMNMACTLFCMTPQEALAGITRNAALALGQQDNCGTLEAGKNANIAIWDVTEPAELAYRIGFNPLNRLYFLGKNITKTHVA
ncbi:Imidazolonepropionase [Pseudovibrio axinellae]|uniref:Imidazolonepropionase n=1 Tax=Pseudovibrio axinellae TaxID=989403 RepID=A0A166BBT6_9HYPH|nr:imidazolonepropionase [Pseudovibrio axinellae]KZL22105.1 Imidazolonepropionase [Pseudovibrio axinellae]SEQ55092.1 imidazolonepropionase [Pseudovibrio axinellae]